ncbi:MAG: sulfotransferase [Bacteroidales bacterium]|nr:sulfotransferase [Bacteroidales bacterium]
MDPFKLDADAIIQKTRKKANFTGELPGQVDVGLHKMIAGINKDARLNPFGKLAVKSLLERTLYGRFKVEQVLAENPEIEKAEIKQPVFIIGMPRTGTSILHAMMHEDPAHRSPLAWECLLPYPVPRPENFADNDQLKTIRREFEQLFKLVPDFLKKHYMAADAPQECLAINNLDFNSFQISAQLYAPTYMKWFAETSDSLATMHFHKRFLQYLQSGGVKAERWLLKSPVHLMRLDEIFEVYPDAQVIMTHREPVKVVASIGSLLTSVRSLYSNFEDPIRTGREQMKTWHHYFDRFLESRKRLQKEDQIIDLHFEDFAGDHIGTAKKIYDKFGWKLSDEAIVRFKTFLTNNPRDKNGLHMYHLEDFGLTEDEVNEKFKAYIEFMNRF